MYGIEQAATCWRSWRATQAQSTAWLGIPPTLSCWPVPLMTILYGYGWRRWLLGHKQRPCNSIPDSVHFKIIAGTALLYIRLGIFEWTAMCMRQHARHIRLYAEAILYFSGQCMVSKCSAQDLARLLSTVNDIVLLE